MKNSLPFAILGIMMMILTACGPTSEQARIYNDAITDEQNIAIDKIDAMMAAYDDYKTPGVMDNAYAEAITAVDEAIKNISAMDDFDGATDFRDAAVDLCKVYKSVLQNELMKMMEIYKLPEDQYTETEENEWNSLQSQAVQKMDEKLVEVQNVQAKFAEKYGFMIEDTE